MPFFKRYLAISHGARRDPSSATSALTLRHHAAALQLSGSAPPCVERRGVVIAVHPEPPFAPAAPRAPRTRQRARRRIAGCAVSGLIALQLLGCGDPEPPPGAGPSRSAATKSGKPAPGADPRLPAELTQTHQAKDAGVAEAADAAADAAPYTGPYFAVTKIAAAVFSEPKFDQKLKLGYIRNGGRSPVDPKAVSTTNCSSGWFKVNDVGYVCGNLGTTDLEHPEVKFAIKQPDLSEVLPYVYARNAKNGTPLYRSVPSKEQMLTYEPYLDTKKKAEDKAKAEAKAKEDKDKAAEKAKQDKAKAAAAKADDKPGDAGKPAPQPDAGKPSAGGELRAENAKPTDDKPSLLDGLKPKSAEKSDKDKQDDGPGSATNPDTRRAAAGPDDVGELPPAGDDGDAGSPEQPWWQQDDIKDRLHEVKLEDLAKGSDGILAKRMVTGFYVAVDKTFRWNGRLWYKTTKGLVTPSDRFWQTAGSKFQGVELGSAFKLPVAWAYGGNKSAPTYSIDLDKKSVSPKQRVKRFEAIQLTGRGVEIKGINYSEMADGEWLKNIHVRITRPGPAPSDVGVDERWIDVNVKEQTLVVYRGNTPVYATLISSGKSSNVKSKDHSTPLGDFRVREKHITTTMDGDGSAAGDLPYSIEDVPYVMYYQGSYATHAAFWHANYGVKMSHGCVNLSPLDAKWVFLYADPQLPQGWHGAWSTTERPGSRIRVHE